MESDSDKGAFDIASRITTTRLLRNEPLSYLERLFAGLHHHVQDGFELFWCLGEADPDLVAIAVNPHSVFPDDDLSVRCDPDFRDVLYDVSACPARAVQTRHPTLTST